MPLRKTWVLAGLFALAAQSHAAAAQDAADPGITLKPNLNTRLRYETVDQDGPLASAEAVTLRGRLGVEVRFSELSLLVEGEGTAALLGDYNDTLPGNGVEPFPVVADPESPELNRFQLAWKSGSESLTLGRQRLVLDNARFVGNVGWRQNEQTFDAVRGQAKIGPLALDLAHAFSQRTIFGADSPNEHFDGDIWLVNGGARIPLGEVKAFAYLVDYETRLAFSSQTYGLLAKGTIPLGGVTLDYLASWATQSDHGANPADYRAQYFNAELGGKAAGFTLRAGYEVLGSDGGAAAFQTPLATLHAFNGWADMFLVTPPAGLRDRYLTLGRTFDAVAFLPGLNASVTWHGYDSDAGGIAYGEEWNATLGFRLGPVALQAKYADYGARGFGTDTRKLWLQADYGF